MPFTGVPVLQMTSDAIVRLTGISLDALAVGTIGLDARTIPAEITLPAAFKPGPYTRPGGELVDLVASVGVDLRCTTTGGSAINIPCVDKAGGDPETFLITVTNPIALATNELEIYIKFHE